MNYLPEFVTEEITVRKQDIAEFSIKNFYMEVNSAEHR